REHQCEEPDCAEREIGYPERVQFATWSVHFHTPLRLVPAAAHGCKIVVLAALRMRVCRSLRVFHALQREDSGEQTARRGYSRRSPPSFSKARAACAISIGSSRDRARKGFARIWARKAERGFKSALRPRAYPKRLCGYPLCALAAGKPAGANFMARPPVLRGGGIWEAASGPALGPFLTSEVKGRRFRHAEIRRSLMRSRRKCRDVRLSDSGLRRAGRDHHHRDAVEGRLADCR